MNPKDCCKVAEKVIRNSNKKDRQAACISATIRTPATAGTPARAGAPATAESPATISAGREQVGLLRQSKSRDISKHKDVNNASDRKDVSSNLLKRLALKLSKKFNNDVETFFALPPFS